MDLPHLVYALIGRIRRSPALHFAVLGTLIFVLVSPPGSAPPPRLVIPASRIETALDEYQSLSEHPLTAEEKQAVVRAVVEQEVLYAYAQRLGMGKDPAVERRLAQIATFVADNPDEAKTTEERADEAAMLGLGEGDLIVRRILIDGARRLIRAAVLIREPTEAALESYLREHSDDFRTTERWRLSQIVIDARLHPNAEQDARRLLEQLHKAAVPPSEAAKYGEPGFAAAQQPVLSARELERRFGHRFAKALVGLPTGSWEGPIPSRFGFHLVLIEEYFPSRVPQLAEVRNEVRVRLREKLADEWLAVRLEQLRSEFAVEIVGKDQDNYQL
ncbi:MAG: peptidyl-prolyl cis-trans isomerase [Methylovulum sp.]|nr:peptidyl-prolyl cis-trans isomerase [Methylovulum sp.]